MKDPKTIVTTAAGLVLVGVATWLIATTQEGTVAVVSAEKEIETLQMQIDDLSDDMDKVNRRIRSLEKHSHDKRGAIELP